jgi:hypothetical protein
MAEMTTKLIFKSFTQHMSTGVPESFLSKCVLKLEELEIAVTFERSCEVPSKPLFILRNI